jgi:hypothetical protein
MRLFGADLVSECVELKPVGGVIVRNKKGEIVGWFKGKDPEGGQSFALCLFRPELADTPAMRVGLERAFQAIREAAAKNGLPLFDMADFEEQLRRTFEELGVGAKEYVKSRRTEDLTFKLTDLATGRKVDVVFGLHPVKPLKKRRRKKRGEHP